MDVSWAAFAKNPPPFAVEKRRRGLCGKGLKYEKEAREWLKHHHRGYAISAPWVMYREVEDESRLRWCQPDALVVRPDRGLVYIVEIKLRHTADAYFQMANLYLPVLTAILRPELWSYRLLEMCRWYDSQTAFPVKCRLRPKLKYVRPDEVGVLIWSPSTTARRSRKLKTAQRR